jgi:pyruvate,orthophosphate dikinase
MGKICVCRAGGLIIDYERKQMSAHGITIKEGESISIDGTTGEMFVGHLETAPSEVTQVFLGTMSAKQSYTFRIFNSVMSWADNYRKLNVLTNADNHKYAKAAIRLGAKGIVLCRTEHMFFGRERIDHMGAIILANKIGDRQKALAKLKLLQQGDFEGIFREMKGYPVAIRLLDRP